MGDKSDYRPIDDGEVQVKRTEPTDQRAPPAKPAPAPEGFSRASHYS